MLPDELDNKFGPVAAQNFTNPYFSQSPGTGNNADIDKIKACQ